MASRSPYWPPSLPPRRGSAPNRGCTATTADGRPCGSPALRGEPFCHMHHPDHAAEVAEARRLGGLRRRKEATLASVYNLGDAGTHYPPSTARQLSAEALRHGQDIGMVA